MTQLAFVITFIAMLVCTPRLTHAQIDGQTAFEGYVFDVATKKPLANAVVTIASGGNAVAIGTNASGFYAIPTGIDSQSKYVITAECTTSRGVASSELPLYTPLRPIVYQRDFYLTLPKRATRCVLP